MYFVQAHIEYYFWSYNQIYSLYVTKLQLDLYLGVHIHVGSQAIANMFVDVYLCNSCMPQAALLSTGMHGNYFIIQSTAFCMEL